MLLEDLVLVFPLVGYHESQKAPPLRYDQFRTSWRFQISVIEIHKEIAWASE